MKALQSFGFNHVHLPVQRFRSAFPIRPVLFGILLWFALTGANAAEFQNTNRFGLADLARMVRISDPQISPDGKSVVIVVSRPNYDKNRYDAELVLVDIATGSQRILTRRSARCRAATLVAVGGPARISGEARARQGRKIAAFRHADERGRCAATHQCHQWRPAIRLAARRPGDCLCHRRRTGKTKSRLRKGTMHSK